MFLWHGPEAYGFRGQVWTCARIALVIEEEFGIRCYKSHFGRLLKELGWTPQIPIRRTTQRNESWMDVRSMESPGNAATESWGSETPPREEALASVPRRAAGMTTHCDPRLTEAIGLVYHALASSKSNASDSSSVVSALHRTADLFRMLGDRGRETDALGNLGLVLLTAGRPTEAIPVLRAALHIAESTGDLYTRNLVLERMALSHLKLAAPTEASKFLDEAIASARTLGDGFHESRLQWTRAIALAELGSPDLAAQSAQDRYPF